MAITPEEDAKCQNSTRIMVIMQMITILDSIGRLPETATNRSREDIDRQTTVFTGITIGVDWRSIVRAQHWYVGSTAKHVLYLVAHALNRDADNVVHTAFFSTDTLANFAQKRVIVAPTYARAPEILSSSTNVGNPSEHQIAATIQGILEKTQSPDQFILKDRKREIRLLQQCLLELEIEYFRVVAENDMYKNQQEVDEMSFIEPWFQSQNRVKARLSAFEKEQHVDYQRTREFRDSVAIKGYASALQGQNNALVAVSGAAVQQRSQNDAMRLIDYGVMTQQSKESQKIDQVIADLDNAKFSCHH
jgi:hypothetical protein